MTDRATKVKEIISKRQVLQHLQNLSADIMYKEVSALRNAIKSALKGTKSEKFADKFNDMYLPLGQRVGVDAFKAVECLEDAVINDIDVRGAVLEDALGVSSDSV